MYATATVLFINAPPSGKMYGNIKTKELGYLSVKDSDLRLFEQNRTYQIEYATKNINGRDYKNFVRLTAPPAPPPQAAAQAKEDQAKHIFITGVVGRAMGSGKFAMTDIRDLAAEAAEAWRQLSELPPEQTEVDEEIPF